MQSSMHMVASTMGYKVAYKIGGQVVTLQALTGSMKP